MEKVIKILMERDGDDYQDAKYAVQSFIDDTYAALENGEDPEYIEEMLMDYLGLEPDYLPDLLY